jgi:multimeric flavodoxin WrbA
MRTLVLDGSAADDAAGAAALAAVLAVRPDARVLTLRDLTVGNCAGDFFCWIRSPGECNVDDDNRVVAAEMMGADLMVLLTPVTFGGYSAHLKRAVDHFLPNISPFFRRVDGETRHRPRYRRYPDVVVVGWLPEPDERAEQVFRHLVARNGINFYADRARCDVLVGDLPAETVAGRVRSLVEDRAAQTPGGIARAVPALTPDLPDDQPVPAPGRVVLLTGSPRTAKSSSHFLGRYLLDRLAARGAEVDEIQLYTSMGTRRRPEVLDRIAAADLLVLAFPLYVDALPGPVVAALDHVREHLTVRGRRPDRRLVALVNCGFPEPGHNATAMAITALAARGLGLGWGGGLSLGGGEGVVGGRPLTDVGRVAGPLRDAFDLAADALADGRPVPTAANALLARPLIPARVYAAVGNLSWLGQARHHGVARKLLARPLEPTGG